MSARSTDTGTMYASPVMLDCLDKTLMKQMNTML